MAVYRWLLVLGALALGVKSQAQETLEWRAVESAGISGFRVQWDQTVLTAPDGVRTVKDKVVTDWGAAAPWSVPGRTLNGALRPAALSFDAIHRSLLLRFPGAAEAIAAKLAEGHVITKAELVLPWTDDELWPEGDVNGAQPQGGYVYRANWGVDALYREHRPTWHAVAWALQKPWTADADAGPTYNAAVNGAIYWERFGATGASDRVDRTFGPTPVHHAQPTGRMDVTASLTDAAYGETLGARLRRLEHCGFLLKKWETYDHRYFTGVYEWGTATGGRAIIIGSPTLVLTLQQAAAPADLALPDSPLRPDGGMIVPRGAPVGRPTAVMPTRAELKAFAEQYAMRRPAGMPDWQWGHIGQLLNLEGKGADAAEPFWYQFVPNYIWSRYTQAYGKKPKVDDGWLVDGRDPEIIFEAWIDSMLNEQYRGWHGFSASKELLPWYVYRDTLPAPVQQWFRDYWTAWLLPDRPTSPELFPPVEKQDGAMIHPMYDQLQKGSNTSAKIAGDSYYLATGDWRGNKSFYRGGFNYAMSTTNFNNTASMGCLLGGALIGSAYAIADGRHGQATWPLATWTWYDGTTQEEGDDYYFGITMKAQKMMADFGPELTDRLLGRSQLLKSSAMISDSYHPGLRRYIYGAARTSPRYRIAMQEGLYGILHTLSEQGALTDLGPDADTPEGFPSFGHEYPMDDVARQAAAGPWAPLWFRHVLDAKPVPYQSTATFKQWGGHVQHPVYRRSYLGAHFGLYSASNGWGFIPVIAQWRRGPETVSASRQLGTMFARVGYNDTRMLNDAYGWIAPTGNQVCLQDGPRLLISASLKGKSNWVNETKNIRSVQASLAFYNYETPTPTWTVYLNGRPLDLATLPVSASQGDHITIHDGLTYIGIIPLPSADLGRRDAVLIRPGTRQEMLNNGNVAYHLTSALVIDCIVLQRDEPLGADTDWDAIDRAHTGFAVEYGDAASHGSFAAFQSAFLASTVSSTFAAEGNVHRIRYAGGGRELALDASTVWPDGDDTRMDKVVLTQTVNGEPAYLPAGIDRDSPFTQQGTGGHLTKQGVDLYLDDGRTGFLLTPPGNASFGAYHPLATPSHFRVSAPGGLEILADGKVGLLFTEYDADAKRLSLDHAFIGADGAAPDAARCIAVAGIPAGATLVYQGQETQVQATQLDGVAYVLLPLAGDLPSDVAARLAAARAALAR